MRAHTLAPALLALAGIATACSGDEGSDAQPVINSFEISATDVSAGQPVTLTWSTVDADSIEIYSSEDPATPFYTGSEASGSTSSPPVFAPQTFTLFAKNSASGNETSAEVEVLAVSGLQIAEFIATPMNPEEDEMVTLSWRIGGDTPTRVIVKDDTGADIFEDDSPNNEGSFELVPVPDENGQATYRLQVRGAGTARDEAMVTVMVNVIIDEPVIEDFYATSTDVAKGSRAQLQWRLSNTERFRILLNGTEARRWISITEQPAQAEANARITVNEDTNVFVLEAESEDGVVATAEVTVRGLDVPVIDVLEVSPTSYTFGSTVATVTWETSNADSVNLQLNGRDVANFPRDQTAGTFQLMVSGAATLTFIATNPVQDTTRDVMIELGYEEPEPNEGPANAIAIPADGLPVRGTVTTPGDVDWYTFMVPDGSYLYVQAGIDDVAGCVFDTIVRLYDSDGTTELGFADNTTVPNISPCSEINPIVDDYAARLPAGTYYLSVGGSGTMNVGQYNLIVRLVTPAPALTGLMPPAVVGSPTWEVVDYVQFSAPLDANIAVPWSVGIDPIFGPMHVATGGNGLGVLTTSNAAHTPDYDTELRMAMGMRGVANRVTRPATEIIEPAAMYVGFTIAPAASSTITGSSADFADGPIISRSLYPLSVELDFESGGMPLVDPTAYDIVFTGGMNQDGNSHDHVFAAVRAGAGTPPGDLAATYSWEYTILDSTGSGYTFAIPLTLTAN